MLTETAPAQPTKLVRISTVLELVPISRPTIYRMMAKGEFPKAIKLGSSSCWDEAEINAWTAQKLNERS